MFDWKNELNRKGHRIAISGQPIAMHCHHYNINLQKTLEDNMGEAGVDLLYRSVEETIYLGLSNLFKQYPKIKTLNSKLEMISLLYQNCGLGILHFQSVRPNKALVLSPSSHHVTGWLAKHGRRDTPGCHFARGWIAGALEAVYRHPVGYFSIVESQCKMSRDRECLFSVAKAEK
ncbi:MAG: 4-vinyl reductase [Deltaproteobacteria bacterium]|nr:4-vinyl reductase [Deltaproteobacteria bacterium]